MTPVGQPLAAAQDAAAGLALLDYAALSATAFTALAEPYHLAASPNGRWLVATSGCTLLFARVFERS